MKFPETPDELAQHLEHEKELPQSGLGTIQENAFFFLRLLFFTHTSAKLMNLAMQVPYCTFTYTLLINFKSTKTPPMKKQLYLLATFCIPLLVQAQGTWTQKANYGGTARNGATGFSIGSKGYMGTGDIGGTFVNDFWEYDPSSNVWTQKANMGPSGRRYCFAFVINGKGYMGTGEFQGYIKQVDFYEYDPVANTWTQKSNFPGTARTHARGFAIGSKGYAGTGFNNNSGFSDFYEYNPSTDSWTAKATFSGGARYAAMSFTINSLGYITGGSNGSMCFADIWEYNPVTDSWSQKAVFPGTARYGSAMFAISAKGYVCCGASQSGTTNNELWTYDQGTNSWTQLANMTGGTRIIPAGFSVGNKGYTGTGSNTNGVLQDFYEFAPGPQGITEQNAITFEMFPNPVVNRVTVKLASADKAQLEVFDMLGKRVMQDTFEGFSNETDLSLLPAGMYTLRVTTSKGWGEKKITKQ
jgi:N-acetylneuraminic acid mutarotase